ncbi:MAG: Uncharacterised protein [Gammaproteobacteria bacterium]|jgi:hypothetical protein|nr:MAG: Uncharacterised protein [Gammaproteobacteria bacterium]
MSNLTATRVAPAGITNLLQNMAKDCTPTQFVREFIKNALEALQRTHQGEKKILIDVNWDHFERTGTYKLSFTDNGDGMTGEEMVDLLNSLSNSGHHNEHVNYGVGAKIAALTTNHAGIEYESWKDGAGNQIWLAYDQEEHVYGIVPEIHDGNRFEFLPISQDSSRKPSIIKGHGTRVTVHGMTVSEDTMSPPDGARGGKENWLVQYANTKFFELPQEIDLQVRVGYYRERDNKKHNYTRKIEGQKAILDRHSNARGTVTLSDVTVHWWIMDPERQDHARQFTSGHTACINGGEVLNILDGRSHKAVHFGVLFGKEDVIIYLEPNARYSQNISRTTMVFDGNKPLPWDRWQDEFRQQLPPEIEAFVRQRMAGSVQSSHGESIKERLKSIAAFFKISRYKPGSSGNYAADPSSLVPSNIGYQQGPDPKPHNPDPQPGPGPVPGPHRADLLADLLDSGVVSDQVNPDQFPTVYWVSGDSDIEDRAATYVSTENAIKANSDFAGFTDVIDHFAKSYVELDGANELIADVVKEAFEQQLIEAVAGAQSLKNRPKWGSSDFETAVSDEALTTAILPRYLLLSSIKRTLGNKLGALSRAQAEAV